MSLLLGCWLLDRLSSLLLILSLKSLRLFAGILKLLHLGEVVLLLLQNRI